MMDIDKDSEDLPLTQLIIDIGKIFKKVTLAEEVETKRQEELLKQLGCTYAQGFLYAKPLPINEFEELVRKLSKPSSTP